MGQPLRRVALTVGMEPLRLVEPLGRAGVVAAPRGAMAGQALPLVLVLVLVRVVRVVGMVPLVVAAAVVLGGIP